MQPQRMLREKLVTEVPSSQLDLLENKIVLLWWSAVATSFTISKHLFNVYRVLGTVPRNNSSSIYMKNETNYYQW